MPIFVGDPIVEMRAEAPDPCGILAPPLPLALSWTGASVAGSSMPAGPSTYYFKGTFLTPWGETVQTTETTFVLSPPNNQINGALTFKPAGASALRVYFAGGGGSGQQDHFQQFDLSQVPVGAGLHFSITSLANSSGGLVPTRSSAYLPDSDGSYLSAAIAFRWLNTALKKMVVQLGGIRDISGVAWPSQAAWQVLSNRWTEIENIWWSGWYQFVGKQEYTWLQNPVTSVPGYATHWGNAGRDIMGLWPQPGTGPGVSVLTAPMSSTDQVFSALTGTLQFPGMVQIEDEMVLVSSPNQPGTQALGVIRGVGGSLPAAHASGAPVTQLITMFTGSRLAPDFAPGSAYTLMQLPAGWDVPISRYMLARYRSKEQLRQEAAELDNEFTQMVESLRTSKDAVPKDRQVGDGRVYNSFLGSGRTALPFGILVP